jgi:hypothetical protein
VPATPRLQRGRVADAASGRRPQPRQAGWPAVPTRSARRPSPSPPSGVVLSVRRATGRAHDDRFQAGPALARGRCPPSAQTLHSGVVAGCAHRDRLLWPSVPVSRPSAIGSPALPARGRGRPAPLRRGHGRGGITHTAARRAAARRRARTDRRPERTSPPGYEGLDEGRPAWDIRGTVGSGVASTPSNCPGHGVRKDASGTHL